MAAGASTYSIVLCELIFRKMGKSMTRQEFFERSGISQATWSRINRGLSHLNIEDVRSAARTIGFSVSELIADAEIVVNNLPNEDIEIVELRKVPRGKTAQSQPGLSGTQIAGIILAGAAITWAISKILQSR